MVEKIKNYRKTVMRLNCLSFINTYIFGPALPVTVFAAGIFMSARLGFFHIFKADKVFKGIFKKTLGKTSPVKAMSVALAGTLGVGNIAGVAGAIALGGAGSVFWMWLSALAAMLLKYSEIMLAVKYRRSVKESGKVCHSGGSFMYMAAHNNRITALLFAVLCIITSITMGSIVQSNAISVSLLSTFNFSPFIVGIVIASLTLLIISGGFSKVADITVRAVPSFCILYTVISMYIILSNISLIPGVIRNIMLDAFSLRSAGSGILSFAFVSAVRFGVARGILSNEAGSGTSPTAHAGSDTDSACEQGFFGIIEVFVDTILLCSMTAFVILLSGETKSQDAMLIAINSFSCFLGSLAPYFISVCIVFFAFGTIICWSVYGTEALRFILSDYSNGIHTNTALNIYRFVYSLSVFLGMLIPSALMWELSDLSVSVMTVINSVYILLMSKEICRDTKEYFNKT